MGRLLAVLAKEGESGKKKKRQERRTTVPAGKRGEKSMRKGRALGIVSSRGTTTGLGIGEGREKG